MVFSNNSDDNMVVSLSKGDLKSKGFD